MEKSEVMQRLHQAESGEAGKLLHDYLSMSVREALYELVEGTTGDRQRLRQRTCRV